MKVASILQALRAARTRRIAYQLRTVMRAMERSAIDGDLRTLRCSADKQDKLARKLRRECIWPDDQLLAYLGKDGLIQSLHDPRLEELVARRVEEAERHYRMAA